MDLIDKLNLGKTAVQYKFLKLINKDKAKAYLVNQLGQMTGLPAKISQTLAMNSEKDAAPAATPEAMPVEWVKGEIAEHSPALSAEIAEISADAITASLGQVHVAKLKSGKTVAIKVRYPDVDKEVAGQLGFLLSGFDTVPFLKKYSEKSTDYDEFLSEYFKEETDYAHEAENQTRFKKSLSAQKNIVVAEVYPEFSTSNILVQSYEPALQLRELKTLDHDTRVKCANQISTFFVKSIVETGAIHADFHEKNWGYRVNEDELVLYDFGGVLWLNPEIRSSLIRLFTDKNLSNAEVFNILSDLGFDDEMISQIAEKLSFLCSMVVKACFNNDESKKNGNSLNDDVDKLLGAEKWLFRMAGPPWFLIFMRTVQGWIHACRELGVSINIDEILKTVNPLLTLQAFDRDKILSQLKTNVLKVRVLENGSEIVSVELPARAVEDLESIVPDNVLKTAESQGIDFSKIKAAAIESGLKPQKLFEASEGSRNYKVWIE